MWGMMLGLSSPAAEQFLDRLPTAQSACLMLDYDGTLAPLTTDRSKAAPYAGIPALVASIARSGRTRLAVISGRSISDVRELLMLEDGIEYWGSHGAEYAGPDGQVSFYRLNQEQLQGLTEAQQCLTELGLPAKQIELKPFSIALHWRGLDQETAQRWQLQVVPRWLAIAVNTQLAVQPFSEGVEVRPADATKAAAVLRILDGAGECCLPAYLGDDLTDEGAFSVIPKNGLGILVGDVPRQTGARLFLRRPQEVLGFLEQWLEKRG